MLSFAGGKNLWDQLINYNNGYIESEKGEKTIRWLLLFPFSLVNVEHN